MIDPEAAEVLLNELSKLLKDKEQTICLQKYQIDSLKEKLSNAEVYHKDMIEKRGVSNGK